MIDLERMTIMIPEIPGDGSTPAMDAPVGESPAPAAADGPDLTPSAAPDDPVPSSGDGEVARLRQLLFARELAAIERLERLQNDPHATARKVGEVLAEAIQLRSKDEHFNMVLEPVVDAIVKSSLKNRQNDFITALSPLMGPTIRKSIAESFRSMMGDFSKSLEMAFSWKGLRWRFEALRSGKPFSEVVMLHTLVYRVEQLFLIHSETGLVLAHLAGESVDSQDADMVSAMLTAVRDFARDCFAGGRDDALNSLQLGDFTLHIESGTHAYLACVLRGTPPGDFHARLRATLDMLHVEYGDEMRAFDGDADAFAGSVASLEPLLMSRYVDEDKPLSLYAKLLPVALLLATMAVAGFVFYNHVQTKAENARIAAEAEARREAFTGSMRGALDALRAEPGLLLAEVRESPEPPWDIVVLKDPLGPAPGEVFRARGTDPALFAVKTIPYVSYDPAIVIRRLEQSIEFPDTVNMVFDEEGTLTFTGTAPIAWIASTLETARAIPGVRHVDISGVKDPGMERIYALVAVVENTVVEFPLGRDTPIPADVPKLNRAVDALVEIDALARRMGFSASLTIYGHADTVGDPRRNYEISQARARMVAGLLYAKGSAMPVTIYGIGSEFPRSQTGGVAEQERGSQASRRIELRVHLALSPSAASELFRRQ